MAAAAAAAAAEEPPDRGQSAGRSRSRLRASPSELLARRQHLLGAGAGSGAGAADPSSPERPAADAPGGAATELSQAVARLESLSELLKSHEGAAGERVEQRGSQSMEDLYILLAKKEKDLQLAAELGKALLEKNEQLSRANERITEDYSHKLELLEQDKHKLKRQMSQLSGELENKLIELQTDCNILKNQLDEQQQAERKRDKERSKLIDDLVQQNQRLTGELSEATKSEELLSRQLEKASEEQGGARLGSRRDHAAQLDTLKEEIQVVNQRKQDLERRLKLAQKDRSSLGAALDESGDRILVLEGVVAEREARLNELETELLELRDAGSWLSKELESMVSLNERLCGSAAPQSGGGGPEVLDAGLERRDKLLEELRELRLRTKSRLRAGEFLQARRVAEAARPTGAAGRKHEGRRAWHRPRDRSLRDELLGSASLTSSSSSSLSSSLGQEQPEAPDWGPEAAGEIWALLRRFQGALEARRRSLERQQVAGAELYPSRTADDSGISADDSPADVAPTEGSAATGLGWRKLLANLEELLEDMPCSNCRLMIKERAELERLERQEARLSEEARAKAEQVLQLSALKEEQEARLGALEERCRLLASDLSNCDRPKEEIVQLAWKARDEAVARKNSAEIALAKTRVENMQLSSQLMEAVQQKGELSQRLAQFEDDIHYITQHSVKAKFTWEEWAEKQRRARRPEPTHSNPLAQLLSGFSSRHQQPAAAAATGEPTAAAAAAALAADNGGQSRLGEPQHRPPAGLMRNFTSNRFNLRFWQRGSGEKQPNPQQQQQQQPELEPVAAD